MHAAAAELRSLGAKVSELPLFASEHDVLALEGLPAVLIFEVGGRLDWVLRAVTSLRKNLTIRDIPSLAVVPERLVAQLPSSAPFDDFIVAPYFAAELYARIRRLEWRASSFSTEETLKHGELFVDRAAYSVTLRGEVVPCARMEFKLLCHLLEKRGKLLTREQILRRVWGANYDGGARTVDIHVRRLRAKFGEALPLETIRGGGYKLRP
ncbi:MAG: response regulator transcription factor [Polyangiaceae bacterium]